MKKSLGVLVVSGMLLFLFCGSSFAGLLTGYTNITINDGVNGSDSWQTGSNEGSEDQEVEVGAVGAQEWDLEGFFLYGTTLALVGGFDFDNGVVSGSNTYTSGDIFIDVDGFFGSDGAYDSGSSYGYEYVLALDFTNSSYTAYSLDSNSKTNSVVYYATFTKSNPWTYASGGTDINAGGSFVYEEGKTNGYLGTNFLGSDGTNSTSDHNIMTFDVGFLAGESATFHFTEGCGNDTIKAYSDVPVPEPTTLLLMGVGLLGLASYGRKRFSRKS